MSGKKENKAKTNFRQTNLKSWFTAPGTGTTRTASPPKNKQQKRSNDSKLSSRDNFSSSSLSASSVQVKPLETILSNNGRCQDNPTGKEDDMVLATASYVSSDRDDGDNEEYLYREECDVKPPSLF